MHSVEAPEAFRAALASLASAPTRAEVRLVETPAPSRVAPFAAAINGTVMPEDTETTGRFILLHDPAGPDAWDGDFRIVTLVRARVETEVGGDDLWADVAWSWLTDSLAGIPHRELGGTVTKVVNRSFGQLAGREDAVTVEMRISWTPDGPHIAPHIVAWTELLTMCAGIPPVPEGVAVLPGGHV